MNSVSRVARRMTILGLFSLAFAPSAPAQPPPDYDFQWSVIGQPGNPGYDGPDPLNRIRGRGKVDYTYRISSLEISTAQWLEFVNTVGADPDATGSIPAGPRRWGAEVDTDKPFIQYKLRDVPDAARIPVAGISWRDAARYCNWLHNGKSSDISTLEHGAYDTSTFGDVGLEFTDQRVHDPGAKFWIPTLDEWLKAAHYDPGKSGPGHPGWWLYPTTSDTAPIGGIPGAGQTNTKFTLGGAEWDIPIGSYPDTRSPWGLLDASGSAMEWLEDVSFADPPHARLADGSNAGDLFYADLRDEAGRHPSAPPSTGYDFIGLRVASMVPSVGPLGVVLVVIPIVLTRRRRDAEYTLGACHHDCRSCGGRCVGSDPRAHHELLGHGR